MKPRSLTGLCLLFLILSASTAHAQIFSPLPPEVWPDIIDTPPTPDSIIIQIRQHNYDAAWRMAKDLAIITARQQVHNYFNSKVQMTRLAATLNKIIDDPAKSDTEKKDELLNLTDASLEPTVSSPAGELNLTMQHSIELGVTRLEWDDRVRHGSCSGGYVSTSCTGYGSSSWNCSGGATYSTVFYKSQPDYIIYRIVNGQEKVITRIRGYMANSGTQNLSITPNFWNSVWATAKYYYNQVKGVPYRDVVPGRAFFYDFNADLHNPGDTLQYKVVTHDDWFLPPSVCGAGTGSNHTTTVTADGDGNGRMDYLSSADYAKFFKKYYGWLPGLISSMLE